MVLNFSKLSETQVRDYASSAVFQRGKDYFKDGCVRDALIIGASKLEGHVQGNSLYKTKVMIEDGELVCECNCPFDWEPFCKHGIALLLYWINKKNAVPALETMKGRLMSKSKEELADLVLKAARNDAKLCGKINTSSSNNPISFEAFQKRVSQIFSQQDFWNWDEVAGLAEELTGMIDEGEDYLTHGDAASALACFEAIAYGIIKKVNDTHTEGQLEEVFSKSVEQMVVAFNKTSLSPKPAREKLEKWVKTAIDGEYGFEDDVLQAILENLESKQLYLAEETARKISEETTRNKKRDSFKYHQLVDSPLIKFKYM